MTDFRRHLPTDNSVVSLHVALNRAWDAIEAIGKAGTASPSKTHAVAGVAVTPSGGGGSSTTTVHNALTGIQGGNIGDYYHLTGAEYAGVGTGVFIRASSLPTLFTSVADGLVGASGGGTTKYLRADGTWIIPPAVGFGGFNCGDSTTAAAPSPIINCGGSL